MSTKRTDTLDTHISSEAHADVYAKGSIKDFTNKIKSSLSVLIRDDKMYMALLLITIGITSYGLGRLSVQATSVGAHTSRAEEILIPRTITNPAVIDKNEANASTSAKTYVASKNSDKYHLPWCSGAQRIAEKNKIWFATKEEAAAAGYTPAGNCKGI